MSSKILEINDLCIVNVAKSKKNALTDPDRKCVSLAKWLPNTPIDSTIKKLTEYIFNTLASGGLSVPYIDLDVAGIFMTWDNDSEKQRRILYISIQPGRNVRYQVSVHPVMNGDHDWKFITDSDTIASMMHQLAHYLQGTPNAKRASA